MCIRDRTAITHQRHDSAALDRAGKSFNSVSIGENLNTWQGLTGPFTLNDIKKYVYEAMLDFMFNGNEWNHARSISGPVSYTHLDVYKRQGVATYIKDVAPSMEVIGVEASGARSMRAAFDRGYPVKLEEIDKFADGIAVQKVGVKTYEVARKYVDRLLGRCV